MRERRPWRHLASALVVLLLLPSIPLGPAAAVGPTPQAVQGSYLPLYFHQNNTLSVVSNAGEFNPGGGFTQRQWDLAQGMTKTVCVDGNAPSAPSPNFVMRLNISGFSSTQVTAYLKDEGTIIAEQTQGMSGFAWRITAWSLASTSNRTVCDILRGHRLQVELVSNRTVSVDILPGANIGLYVWDAIVPDAVTANAAGPATLFYPNDLDGSRQVIARGRLNNAFTPALVSGVAVQIRDPAGGTLYNGSASLLDDNYTMTWSYSKGLAAGTYSVGVTVTDTSGNTYNASASFTLAAYGLAISVPGASGGSVTQYTTVGTSAEYAVTVTNVGASPTGVLMATENAPAPGWTTDFTDSTFPLEPGASHLTYFHANPSSTIGPGNSTQITIVAQANDDPAAIKARAFLSTTTIIRTAITITITPHQTDGAVKLGGTASYDFRVNNSGGLSTDVLFNATAPPAGWDRDLSGGVFAEGSGWRLIGLPANSEAQITLGVLAPNASTGETTFVCTVSAISAGNPSAGDTFVATTRLLLGIELRQAEPIPTQPKTNPGMLINFLVELTNTDPLNRHDVAPGDVSFFESTSNPQPIDGQFGGSITLDRPTNCCDAGESGWLTVTVQLPSRALFGVYEIRVSAAVDGDPNRVVQLNLSLQVVAVYSFSFHYADERSQFTLVEGSATIPAVVENAGNVAIDVRLKGTIVGGRTPPVGWAAVFTDSTGAPVTSLSLPPYTTLPVDVTVTAAKDALNGDTRKVNVTLERVGSPSFSAPLITVTVELSPSSSLSRMFTIREFVLGMVGAFAFGLFALWLARDVVKKGTRPSVPKPPAKPPVKSGADKPSPKAASPK